MGRGLSWDNPPSQVRELMNNPEISSFVRKDRVEAIPAGEALDWDPVADAAEWIDQVNEPLGHLLATRLQGRVGDFKSKTLRSWLNKVEYRVSSSRHEMYRQARIQTVVAVDPTTPCSAEDCAKWVAVVCDSIINWRAENANMALAFAWAARPGTDHFPLLRARKIAHGHCTNLTSLHEYRRLPQ